MYTYDVKNTTDYLQQQKSTLRSFELYVPVYKLCYIV